MAPLLAFGVAACANPVDDNQTQDSIHTLTPNIGSSQLVDVHRMMSWPPLPWETNPAPRTTKGFIPFPWFGDFYAAEASGQYPLEANARVKNVWSWGDGTPDTVIEASDSDQVARHEFTIQGDLTITLTVTDAAGNTGVDTLVLSFGCC